MRRARAAAIVLGLAVPLALTIACGARSGLLLGEYPDDAGADVVLIDDVALPGLDVSPRDVVQLSVCVDASDTLIYTVTESNSLLMFNPSSFVFTRIGTLACPDPLGRSPFSMAVDRQGNAYVLYFESPSQPGIETSPGSIFKVDLNSAVCEPTNYVPSEAFPGFGMGFASNDTGTGETLYVANSDPGELGAINENTLALTAVGAFSPTVSGAELTGTGDGRLFAFWAPGGNNTPGSAISQIDKTNAHVIAQASLPGVTQGNGWAFGFWGGDFYLFTSPQGAGSIVQRYDPASGKIDQIADYPEEIVGAGVSTCAPVQ